MMRVGRLATLGSLAASLLSVSLRRTVLRGAPTLLALSALLFVGACTSSNEQSADQSSATPDGRTATTEGLPAVSPGAANAVSSSETGSADCTLPGGWEFSCEAAWLRRAAGLAGLKVVDDTGSAWVVEGKTSFYLWTSDQWSKDHERAVYGRLAGTTIYGDDVRLWWRAQGLVVWLEPGPGAGEPFPPNGSLARLVAVTQRLPRLAKPIEMMATPYGPLAKCRRDEVMRPACPTRIPRIPGWNTYGNPPDGVFGIQRGGEYPDEPALNRPPGMLHIEVWAGRAGHLHVAAAHNWPTGEAVRPRNGLLRLERTKPMLLGEFRWGGKTGALALMPGYPVGGSLGNHLVFRWRNGGFEYLLSLHAWEPLRETVKTLRAVVESAPRSDEEPVYPGDPGQVIGFGEFSIVRPQEWSSWPLYGGLLGPGLQVVSDQVREPAIPGEVDPIKAMVGNQVAVTFFPAGRVSQRDDVVVISRDDLLTEGEKVPRGRAIVDRLVCRGGGCFYVHVEFAKRRPSDDLLQQVNRLIATLERNRV